MRSYIYILLAFSFCLPASVFAEAVSTAELREIQSKLKSSNYLTVQLEQKSFKTFRGGRTSTSSGRLHYCKPEKFRWILTKPIPNEWIFNGSKVCNYAPEERSATCYKSSASQAREIRQIIQLVTDIDALLSSYNLKSADMKKQKVHIELTPKSQSSVEKVDLVLDLKRNYISYLKLYFTDKNHSTFNFTRPETKKIPSGVFDVPKGVKVSNAL